MTAPDLDALERAAQAATPGPWYQSGSPWFSTGSLVLSGSPDRHAGYMIVDTDPLDYREDIPDGEVADPDDDAAYIAAANPAAIRSLIARLREAERQRDEARAALEKAQTQSLIVDLANDLRRRGNATTSEEIGVGLHEAATLVEALATHPAFRP